MAHRDGVQRSLVDLGGTEARDGSGSRQPLRPAHLVGLALLLVSLWPSPSSAQAPLRKIGELELAVRGLSATVEPENPVVPKNVASAVRVVVRTGGRELSAGEAAEFLGADFEVQAELSGPGLTSTLSLPQREPGDPLPADPLLLHFPPLPTSGDYSLANLRIVAGGRTVLDVAPSRVTVDVIERVLVTSVQTRPLTLDEIVARGVDLSDAENYLGFGFTLGMKLESEAVQISFPVIFDRDGAVVPVPLQPPPAPPRAVGSVSRPKMPTIVPLLLEAEGDSPDSPPISLQLPGGEPVRIPGLLVIPGDVGYLKQFFSAQLFVANGAPVGSGLVVSNVEGTIELPPGPDGVPGPGPGGGESDDPLSLPDLVRDGEAQSQPATLPVRGLGLDEIAGTEDDALVFAPGEQGLADFTIRGDAEGFHPVAFDIHADLDGLPVGRVKLKGRAEGGVLVRNPYFDLSFTAPSVVRTDETFTLYVTVTNVGQGTANLLNVSIDHEALSGAQLLSDAVQGVPELEPGDSRTLEYEFLSQRTGQVVASYLRFDTGADVNSGSLEFQLAVGERGVPLSPDTLVLPTAVDALPRSVVRAAMRVLGQAWSVANSPSLPAGVLPIDRSVVQKEALALAEAGLRTTLGQDPIDAVRDLAWDFYSGEPAPDAGFDQLLRTTEAGRGLALALGTELGERALSGPEGPRGFEREWARLLASGPDFVTFVVASGSGAASVDIAVVDDVGQRTLSTVPAVSIPHSEIPGLVLVPLGGVEPAPVAGLLTSPTALRYTLELQAREAGPVDVAVTLPRGDGTVSRGEASATLAAGERARVVLDLARPTSLALEHDPDDGGVYRARVPLNEDLEVREPEGPQLLSAHVIGPETLDGASPFGVYAAFLFDRVVDGATAADPGRYALPSNEVRAAARQLSGRLVFASLDQPEGPYVPVTLSVDGLADERGGVRPGVTTVELGSLLSEPGAIVTGRVRTAEGEPVGAGAVTYLNTTGSLADCRGATSTGFSRLELQGGGFELRYVRQSPCGPFTLVTQDPATGARREVTGRVRTAGERIVLDLALLGRGSVAGTVRRLAGPGSTETVPAAGVQVAAFSVTDPQSGGTAVTDGDGRYVIDGITVGPVNVRAGGSSGIGSGTGRIDRPGTPAVVDILLDSDAARIHGTVRAYVNDVLSPVSGLQVRYYLDYSLLGAAHTDADGAYVFESVPVGSFRLEAALNTRDKARYEGIATVGADIEADLVIEVPPEETLGTVRGRVVLPDGETGLSGAVVNVASLGTLTAGEGPLPVGSFEIIGIPVRPSVTERVQVRSADGRRSGTRQFVFPDVPSPVVELTVVVSGTGEAHLIVTDHDGNPLGHQLVKLQGSCGDPCGCASATTGPQGEAAVFYDLPVGTHRARAFRTTGGAIDVASGSATIAADGQLGVGTLAYEGTGTVMVEALGPPAVPGQPPEPMHGADVALISKVYVNDGRITCGLVRGESHRGRTDTEGRVTFTDVYAGPVSVSAHDPFGDRNAGTSGTLAGGGDLTLSVVFADTDTVAGELSGTVYLPNDETPAGPGIEVTVNGPLPDVTVQTNADSEYRFAEILTAGTWTLTAVDPETGGRARSKVVLQAGQDARHDVRLKGRGTVRVGVVDGAGDPVSRASVTLEETEYPDQVFDGILDDSTEGIVTFTGVFEGPLSAEASDPLGRGGRTSGVLARPGDTVDLTVALTTTGTVAGVFRMPPAGGQPGAAIPFATVKLLSSGKVIGQTTTAGGADAGRFTFHYVPAGNIRLEALDPLTARTGFGVGTLDTEGQVLEIDVEAQALGTVHGVVTANASPEPLAEITVVSGTYEASAFADADGVYRVEGVPAGHVAVTASRSDGYLKGTVEGTLTEEGQELKLDVALRDTGEVRGVVYEAGLDEPAPLSVVTISVGGAGGGKQTTTTDELTGAFAFDEVPSGSATLTVDVVGSRDELKATVDVPARGVLDDEFHLNGVGSIRGDVDLGPYAGDDVTLVVTLTGTGALPWSHRLVLSDDQTFQLPEVLAGSFSAQLKADTGGLSLFGNLEDEVRAREETVVTLELQPTGRVQGTVARTDGAPAHGAEVKVKTSRGTVTTQVGADGVFVVDGVPAEAVTLEITDPFTGGVARAAGVVVEDGVLDLGTIDLDDSPIRVTGVEPGNGTPGVVLDAGVLLTFSDPLASAPWTQVFVKDGEQTVSGVPQVLPDGVTITLLPNGGAWPDGRELVVTVTTGVTDVFGRHPLEPFTSRFHTVDQSPPQVVEVQPVHGAIQVPGDAVVTVVFDEPIVSPADPSGLVVVARDGGATVPGVVTLSPQATQAVFTPAGPFALDARYTVTVTDAEDASGNRQATPLVSSFTTVDTIPPVLAAASPAPGSWSGTLRPLVRIDVSDPGAGSGIDLTAGSATLEIDGSPATPSLAATQLNFSPPADLSEGSHTVTASVRDRAGNVGALPPGFVFHLDATPPGPAAVTSPMEGQTVRGGLTLTAVAADAVSSVTEIRVFLDGSASPFAVLVAPDFAVTWDTTAVADGWRSFTARAVDQAGHLGPAGTAVGVLVDNDVLSVDILAPPVGTRVRDAVTTRARTSEPVARVDFAAGGATATGALVADRTHEATLDLTGAPEGDVGLTATAFGLLGEEASATVGLVVDRTAPPPPDAALITAEESDAGYALVQGLPGAVEPQATVEVTNTATSEVISTEAALDGSFAVRLFALLDTELSLVAVDELGNRSGATFVTVDRRTTEDGVPLDGLALWVSADQGVTSDGAGNVEGWSDRSETGNDLVATAEDLRPALIPGEFNGWPVLRFDGVDDTVDFTTRLSTIRSVFWVVRESPEAGEGQRNLLGDDAYDDFRGGPGDPGVIWFSSVNANVGNGQTWLNGVLVDGKQTSRPREMSVVSLVTTGDVRANRFGSARYVTPWWGDLAELLVYDRPVTPGERQAVEDYLVRKYRPYTPTVGTPGIAPAGGTFTGSTTVQLSTTTPDAEIRYTTDGEEPTTGSSLYMGPFLVTETTTVKARAFLSGYLDSGTATATFVRADSSPVLAAGDPVLWLRADAGIATDGGSWVTQWGDQSGRGNDASPAAGAAAPQLVPDAIDGLPVVWFDGVDDTVEFTSRLSTIRTVFWVVRESPDAGAGQRNLLGDEAYDDFRGGQGDPGAIWFSSVSGNVGNGQTWLNGVPVDGKQTPRPREMSVVSLVTTGNVQANRFGSARYVTPWWGDLAELIVYDRALGADERRRVEDYLLAKYATTGQVTTPVVSPAGGVFEGSAEVTVRAQTPGAEIRYTLDGTEPTVDSLLYEGPVEITSTLTLKAKAFVPGLIDSATAVAGFTRRVDAVPLDVANLQLWWRADSGVPSGAGDHWEDQSGQGNHGHQSFGGATAVLVPNVANGLPAVRFDGVDDTVEFTSRLSTIRTVFWVVRESPDAGAGQRNLLGDEAYDDFRGGQGDPGAIWFSSVSGNVGNGQTWLNGVPVDGKQTPRPREMSVVSLVTTGNVRANRFGSARYVTPWRGALAELIVYDRALTEDEVRVVEDYLNARYQLFTRLP